MKEKITKHLRHFNPKTDKPNFDFKEHLQASNNLTLEDQWEFWKNRLKEFDRFHNYSDEKGIHVTAFVGGSTYIKFVEDQINHIENLLNEKPSNIKTNKSFPLRLRSISEQNVQDIYSRNFIRFLYINSDNVVINGEIVSSRIKRELMMLPNEKGEPNIDSCSYCGTKDGFIITELDFIEFEKKELSGLATLKFKERKQLALYSKVLDSKEKINHKQSKQKAIKQQNNLKDFFHPSSMNEISLKKFTNTFQQYSGKRLAVLIYVLHKDLKCITIISNSKDKSRAHFVRALKENSHVSMQAVNKYFISGTDLIALSETDSDMIEIKKKLIEIK